MARITRDCDLDHMGAQRKTRLSCCKSLQKPGPALRISPLVMRMYSRVNMGPDNGTSVGERAPLVLIVTVLVLF